MPKLIFRKVARTQGRQTRMPGPNGYRTGPDGQLCPVRSESFSRIHKVFPEHNIKGRIDADARGGSFVVSERPRSILAASSYDDFGVLEGSSRRQSRDSLALKERAFSLFDDIIYNLWPQPRRGKSPSLEPQVFMENWNTIDLKAVWKQICKECPGLREFEVLLRLRFNSARCSLSLLPIDSEVSKTSLHSAYVRLRFDSQNITLEEVWDNFKHSKKAIVAASYLIRHPQVKVGPLVQPLAEGRVLTRIEDTRLQLQGQDLDEAVAEYFQSLFYKGIKIKRGLTEPLSVAELEKRLKEFDFVTAWTTVKIRYPYFQKYSFYIQLTLKSFDHVPVVFAHANTKKPKGTTYIFIKVDLGKTLPVVSEVYKQASPESELPQYMLCELALNPSLQISPYLFTIPIEEVAFRSMTAFYKRHETFRADLFEDPHAELSEEHLYQVTLNYISFLFLATDPEEKIEPSFERDDFEDYLSNYDFLDLWNTMLEQRPGYQSFTVDVSIFMNGSSNRVVHFIDPDGHHPQSESYGFFRLHFCMKDTKPAVLVTKIWNNYPGTKKAEDLDHILTANSTVVVQDKAREFIRNPSIMGHGTDFERLSLALSGPDLFEAACVYLKCRFMDGLRRKAAKWQRLELKEFERRWQAMPLKEVWSEMQEMRPNLGPMSATVRFYMKASQASLVIHPSATAKTDHKTYTYAQIDFGEDDIVLEKVWDNRGPTRNTIYTHARIIAGNGDLILTESVSELLLAKKVRKVRVNGKSLSTQKKKLSVPKNLDRATRIHFMDEFMPHVRLGKTSARQFGKSLRETNFNDLYKRLQQKLGSVKEVSLDLLVVYREDQVTVMTQKSGYQLPPIPNAVCLRLYLSDAGCVVRGMEDTRKGRYVRHIQQLLLQNNTIKLK